jgi:C1A family cysteine protease
VVFGFQVYSGFESDKVAKSGMLSLPAKSEELLGGHAVVIVGFDDDLVIDGHAGAVKVRNSWGEGWGLKGHFWMPYKYVTNPNLADDFWSVLQTIEL